MMNAWSDPDLSPNGSINRRVNPPICEIAIEQMQARLDGALLSDERTPLPDDSFDFDRHLQQCANCRAEWDDLNRLLDLVDELPAVSMPINFAVSLTKVVLRERTKRLIVRRTLVGTASLAAAMLIITIVLRPNTVETVSPAPIEVVMQQPRSNPTAPDLLPFDEARSAVVAITKRTAQSTMVRSQAIWSSAPILESPDFGSTEVDLARATEPLDDAAQTMASAFEPVSTTTRRAFHWVVRDLPALPRMP